MPSSLSEKLDRLGDKIGKVFLPKNKYVPLSQQENAPQERSRKDLTEYFNAKSDKFATNVYPELPEPEYSQFERIERNKIHESGKVPPPKNGDMDPFVKFCLSVGAFVVFFAVFFVIQSIVQLIVGLALLGGLGMAAYEWIRKVVHVQEAKKSRKENTLKRGWNSFTSGIVEILDDC